MRSSAIFLVSVVTSTRSPRRDPVVDLLHEVVDLALGGLDDDLGVDQAGGPHDLLDDLVGRARARRRPGVADRNTTWPTRSMNSSKRSGRLSAADGRRKPCSISVLLAGAVALVLAVQLRARYCGSRRGRRGSRRGRSRAACTAASPGPRPSIGRRVVLDAVAEADLLHHLEVVLGAHAQALGLEQLALLLELGQPLLQLGLDADDGRLHALLAGDVVGGREDDELVERRRTRSPVSGSTTMMRSTSSPNSSMRTAVSS